MRTKKNLSIEEINSVKEDAKGELEALCDSTRDFANQAKEAADRAKASEDASKKNADDSAATLQELKDGIASGDFKGDKGDPGPAGKDAPQIDDTTVTDSAPWSSKHIVDLLCPPIEETGNPLQCHPVAAYPLGVTASWEPTQDGSGEPSPDNIRPISGRDAVKVERCGENLLDEARFPIFKTKNHLMITSKMTLPAGTYTVCILSMANGVYADGADVNHTYDSNKHTFTLARPTAVQLKAYWINERPEKDEYIWLVKGNEWRAYTPYTGQTATLTLPRTIYGGTVDAVTGEGQNLYDVLTLTGEENWKKDDNYIVLNAATTKINVPLNGVCSHFLYRYNYGGDSLFVDSFNIYLGSAMAKKYTLDEWKALLAAQYAAGTPVQIAYKLAEPVPFTATGALPIPALPGVNTIMTDADSVMVTGRADPIKRITDLEDAVASMTNT